MGGMNPSVWDRHVASLLKLFLLLLKAKEAKERITEGI